MKTPSLYNPLQRLLIIQQMIEDAGGEITPEVEEMLVIRKENLAERSEEMLEIICQSEMIKAESERRIERENKIVAAQNKLIERLKGGLKSAVELTGNSFRAGTFQLSLRASSAVIITDADKIPDEYRKPVVVPKTPTKGEPDKALLKKALESDIFIEGAYLDKRKNLNIK